MHAARLVSVAACLLTLTAAAAPSPAVTVLKIAALLPRDEKRLFSIAKLQPGAEIAIERVARQRLLPAGMRLTISYKDSRCPDEGVAMNEAFKLFERREVNVFFGPVCDFPAAPVARQTRFWNIPLVSVGMVARDFGTRRLAQYPLLTRVGPTNLNVLVNTLSGAFAYYGWRKVKLLYGKDAPDAVAERLYYFIADMFVNSNDSIANVTRDHFKFSDDMHKHSVAQQQEEIERVLLEEIGNQYSSEWQHPIEDVHVDECRRLFISRSIKMTANWHALYYYYFLYFVQHVRQYRGKMKL